MYKKITIIDSQLAGLSGDMILSALIDLGADKKKVLNAIYKCENIIQGTKIKEAKFEKVRSNGFEGTRFYFDYEERNYTRKGTEMTSYMKKLIQYVDLNQRSKLFILNSIKTLIDAEAKIHGKHKNEVHLHEASSIDTFVDMIGCAIALEDLKIYDSKIFSTYICVGNGFTTFSHGTIPNPTNAILEIFRGKSFALVGNDLGEVTTPTGAAILVNLSSDCIKYYPPFIPEKVGLGLGEKILKNRPNLLRIVLGKDPVNINFNNDKMYLIETNVDDIDGEIIGNLIQVFINAGARDVTVVPGITKKNRPVNIIRILCDNFMMETLVERLFQETGTSGIRVNEINRISLQRSIANMQIIIKKSTYNIKVKITKDLNNNIVNIKPEFDDLKKISEFENSSLKKIQELVMYQIYKKFKASRYE
ncbi:MAG TPA: nickel pincer cofactor biosynthesis protein LarC [Nitrososphaeraceae archaeon]|nr:nickel pincer cofactor biosynthesis protein LarC [Nitrososphaeraceae archaeon]